jgi:ATP-dependent Lhr-like helicase
MALLARYGVVFWRLLEREPARLPAWRELLRAYRRLESRGEIRGGRFIAGFSASSSRCRRRLECSAQRGGGRRPINGCPCLARIPST